MVTADVPGLNGQALHAESIVQFDGLLLTTRGAFSAKRNGDLCGGPGDCPVLLIVLHLAVDVDADRPLRWGLGRGGAACEEEPRTAAPGLLAGKVASEVEMGVGGLTVGWDEKPFGSRGLRYSVGGGAVCAHPVAPAPEARVTLLGQMREVMRPVTGIQRCFT